MKRSSARAKCLALAALLALAGACGEGTPDGASAGARRDAPAEVDPLFPDGDAGGGGQTDQGGGGQTDQGGGGQPDQRVTDSGGGGTTDRGGPIDRVLREGARGRVSLVIDGDTLHVTVNGWYHRVRMQGINSPECEMSSELTTDGFQYVCTADDEWFGLGAYELMRDLVEGEEVTVRCDEAPGEACPLDAFDRYLAFLETEEGDVAEQLARAGGAMSFTKFSSSRRAAYCLAEDAAIAAGVGMWTLGSREAVLSRMSAGTRDWYARRDRLCSAAVEAQ
jgi:endonuclease YncB( thermonuclease family)